MSNTSPILYSFRRCPYAMRARLAIQSSGVAVRLREIILKNKPEHLIQISPKATIPVLQLSDGSVIDESLEIMDWALAINDPERLLHQHSTQHKLLIRENDGAFKSALDRYKYSDRFPEHPQAFYREQAMGFIQLLEQRLIANRFLFGDTISYADLAIFPFIRQFAGVDQHWFQQNISTQLQRWLQTHVQSERFHACMLKYPQWIESKTEQIFPDNSNNHQPQNAL
ncbi:glutathione S-transferase [Alginatibacterium sediminis]|uniref:Glutathione S-transferase n=1 Tax=Alginatibacterium sediminis TaxID=2164068 RepID=A0A420E7S9_9ALTE|nr:glutathione S-transferase [Alginatibacterium sediminis]RKF14479.1 glutathione S-transferase [Alginatibacterium sediminis]